VQSLKPGVSVITLATFRKTKLFIKKMKEGDKQ